MIWDVKVAFVLTESVKVSYYFFFFKQFLIYFCLKVVCRNVDDCSTGERCVQNKCEIPCAGHSQCMSAQACINGICILGCRSNKDCLSFESCINAKCQST